jgi:hypothetical protein
MSKAKYTPGIRIRRLIICGICYLESCPFSKWVDEDIPGSSELIDEISLMIIGDVHDNFEAKRAAKRTIAEKAELIQAALNALPDGAELVLSPADAKLFSIEDDNDGEPSVVLTVQDYAERQQAKWIDPTAKFRQSQQAVARLQADKIVKPVNPTEIYHPVQVVDDGFLAGILAKMAQHESAASQSSQSNQRSH